MKFAASDVMLVFGGAAAAFGAGMVYVPAGVILAGVLLIAGGVMRARVEPAR